MSAEIPGIRPLALSRETRGCLDEDRGFRHRVRHGYAFRLRPGRLQERAEGVEPCLEPLQQDLEQFVGFPRDPYPSRSPVRAMPRVK
ncbi:hypothetical protein HRbin22_01153 [Candidatus Thermoflexus japonica]|uniref:HepT-like domain-containing protein n=1 Tax=Candidatus Thermoflexus japonica TaxID=2035417 RepID=A0A2H5Y641_9CHLR|nr:hypothetical protein HRbin22_01153 [Candidatus Thermoflexus japonica]